MTELPVQFQNIYDRIKRKVVKKPGLIEAAELFESCSKQLENFEQQGLCQIGASQCYKSCGEEITQAKHLVAAAQLSLKDSRSGSEDNFPSALTLFGRAVDIYLHQNCPYLAYRICLQAGNVCTERGSYAKAIPWFKKAVDIETGSLNQKIVATDLLLKACICEGELATGLRIAHELLEDLEKLRSIQARSLEKLISPIRLTDLLLYLVLEPKSGFNQEKLLAQNLKGFVDSSFATDTSLNLGVLLLSLEEKNAEAALKAEALLSPVLTFEQTLLIRFLVEKLESRS